MAAMDRDWWKAGLGRDAWPNEFYAAGRPRPSRALCRDTALLREALAGGLSPRISEAGISLVYCAALEETPAALGALEALVEFGGPIEDALRAAAVHGRPVVARWCLDRGADPNYDTNGHGWTVLHAACAAGGCAEEVARMLVAAGADPDARDNPSGRAPLDNILLDGPRAELAAYIAARRRVGRLTKPARG